MSWLGEIRFQVQDAGAGEYGRQWHHDEFNPFEKIYYLTEGDCRVGVGEQELYLKPGRLLLVPSHMPLRLRCDHQMMHYHVHFTAIGLGGLTVTDLCGGRLECPLTDGETEAVTRDFAALAGAWAHGGMAAELDLQGRLRVLVARLLMASGEAGLRERSDALERFRPTFEYIRAHLNRSISNAELARLHHWHPTYFANRFAAAVGSSPRHYILRLRIERAQELLAADELTLAQIAAAVGFGDVYYFSRTFKRLTGLPPGRYRREVTG